jgi:hypothetical protein
MRALFALLALCGLAGIVVGVLTMLHHSGGPNGQPFRFENYGGPGPLIGGLILLCTGLYLLSSGKSRE